jgi:hypothetical protein
MRDTEMEVYELVNQYGVVLYDGSYEDCETVMWECIDEDALELIDNNPDYSFEEAQEEVSKNYQITKKEL